MVAKVGTRGRGETSSLDFRKVGLVWEMRRIVVARTGASLNALNQANMTYTIDPFSIQFTETRRGFNATGKILLDGKVVGTINDFAEKIVTDVFFDSEQDRAAFATEARRVMVSVSGRRITSTACSFPSMPAACLNGRKNGYSRSPKIMSLQTLTIDNETLSKSVVAASDAHWVMMRSLLDRDGSPSSLTRSYDHFVQTLCRRDNFREADFPKLAIVFVDDDSERLDDRLVDVPFASFLTLVQYRKHGFLDLTDPAQCKQSVPRLGKEARQQDGLRKNGHLPTGGTLRSHRFECKPRLQTESVRVLPRHRQQISL